MAIDIALQNSLLINERSTHSTYFDRDSKRGSCNLQYTEKNE